MKLHTISRHEKHQRQKKYISKPHFEMFKDKND